MKFGKRQQFSLWRASALVVLLALSAMLAMAGEHQRSVLVMTSTNDPSGNNLVVFKLNTYGTPSLTMVNKLPTGGNGGAGGNAGILQFQHCDNLQLLQLLLLILLFHHAFFDQPLEKETFL